MTANVLVMVDLLGKTRNGRTVICGVFFLRRRCLEQLRFQLVAPAVVSQNIFVVESVTAVPLRLVNVSRKPLVVVNLLCIQNPSCFALI